VISLYVSTVSCAICYRRYDSDEESDVAFTTWSNAPGIFAGHVDHIRKNLGDANAGVLANLAAAIDGCGAGNDFVLNLHRNSRAFRKLSTVIARGDAALRNVFILTCDLNFVNGEGLFATPATPNMVPLADFDAKFNHNTGPLRKIVNSLYHNPGAAAALVPGVFISTPTPVGGNADRRNLIAAHFDAVTMMYVAMDGVTANRDPNNVADVQALSQRVQDSKVAFKIAIDAWDANHADVVAAEPAGSVPWEWSFSTFADLLAAHRYVAPVPIVVPVVDPVVPVVLVEQKHPQSLRRAFKRKSLKPIDN